MRLPLAVLCALLVPAAEAAAPSAEAVKLAGEQKIFSAQGAAAALHMAPGTLGDSESLPAVNDASRSKGGLFEAPRLSPLRGAAGPGAEVGRLSLASQLDRHRDLLTRQLGTSNWNLSVAGDAGFKTFYITFQQGPKLIIKPLGDLNRLRSREGVDIEIEPGLVYNFHVRVGFPDVIRDSALEITPVSNERWRDHEILLGEVLDAVKARSYVFRSQGVEYWVLYGTDVDSATNALAESRSLLFFNYARMNSKGWPLAESSLPVGQATGVSFGDQKVVLERTAGGELVIRSR